MNSKLLLYLVMILVLTSAVAALGVTPGRRTVDFQPDHAEVISFTVTNNEHKDMKLVISARGELATYISLSDVLVDFTQEDESKTFSYKIALPEALDTPGVHEGEILIMEVPSEKGDDGTFVGATVAVVTELRVRVPYKGKYAELGLEVSESKVGETTTFIVPVMNFGEVDIQVAKAFIDILGPTNEKIATIETDEKAVKSKETKELIARWNADVNPGKYVAVATMDYDGTQKRMEKIFTVGDLSIELANVEVKDFKLGGIAKFDILLENKWNQQIDDVYIEMFILSEKGDPITSFKSATESLPPLGSKEISLFWDTENVPQGTYNTKVVIHYGDNMLEKQSKIIVTLDSINTRFIEATGQVIGSEEQEGGVNILLVFGIIVLILINVGWFLYMRKNKAS
ncbi:MAG: hypothetical protein ABIH34_07780 [Nanoarchaeota archaeon]